MNFVTNALEEEMLLYNGLLFCALRSSESIDKKLAKIKNCLAKNANINASDANDKLNTPLHIAVMKDEPDIVSFLLEKGGNPHAKNKHALTPVELAELCKNKCKNEVITIIETAIALICNVNQNIPQTKIPNNKYQNKSTRINKEAKVTTDNALTNESRCGTAGVSGQLYETNLIGLLLLRAIHDRDIVDFYLGTNLSELGALDDIVFKYYLKNINKPRMFFLQAKHRDNPTKSKLTVESILNSNGDFSLDKYFDSYLQICKKKKNKCANDMFKNDSDCDFIIYTSAAEHFQRKKMNETLGKESLLTTTDEGKTFMFDYTDGDVENLLKNMEIFQAKSLARNFAKHIVRKKYKNMLWDELIKVYHVFLAQNIVKICTTSEDYNIGTFSSNFLESNNEILVIMKEIMFKQLKLHDELSKNSSEITLQFKLPKYFGNYEVALNESKYIDLWKVLKSLIEYENKSDSEIIIIDDNIKLDKPIKKYLGNIGCLVGSVLILDEHTGLLKINLEDLSSAKNQKLIEMLKSNLVMYDIKKVRFEFNVKNFPQLSLSKGNNNKKHVTEFLSKLQFHTNQAKENDVENILKNEIGILHHSEYKNSDAYHVEGDVIYLQYHDKIQKWWKTPQQYLTKSCQFYTEAKNSILNSPLSNMYNYIYTTKMDNFELSFKQTVIEVLELQTFMDSLDAKVLYIITTDILLTSIKINQYFKNNYRSKFNNNFKFNYKFIDLNVLTTRDYNQILSEINETKTDLFIFILNDNGNNLVRHQIELLGQINMKIIIISQSNLFLEVFKCVKHKDQNNSLYELDTRTKLRLIGQKNILFQGFTVSFASIIGENMHYLVQGNILSKLIKNVMLKIGKKPTDLKRYNENKEFYVTRRLCRCIKLTKKQRNHFNIIENFTDKVNYAYNNKDILIISNDNKVFVRCCKKYFDKNIHWFRRRNSNILWEKTYGVISNIIPLVEKIECDKNNNCLLEPELLEHLNDRVVIVSAGPGMGKSTLLTHLMMQTKNNNKTMCVVKLNLLDLKNMFSTWQACEIKLSLGLFIPILFREFSLNSTSIENSENVDILLDNITVVEDNNRLNIIFQEANEKDTNIFLEFQVFLNLYNDDKMALILDGFDEICPDFYIEATKLLNILLSSRIQHLWVSCRSSIFLNKLESVLNTFSFQLKLFTETEQLKYLQNKWCKNISKFPSFDESRIKQNGVIYVRQFFDAITYRIKGSSKLFTGTPLHLCMIAEIYQEYFNSIYINKTQISREEIKDLFNLINLYEKMIDIKFYKIRFGEKKASLNLKDPDLKMIIDAERRLFIENHKKFAAYSLLYKKNKNQNNKTGSENESNERRTDIHSSKNHLFNIFTKKDFKLVNDFMEQYKLTVEKTGIIENTLQNQLKFVHLTYAEYFAAEFICDRLLQSQYKYTGIYFINHVLVMKNDGIRAFINAKLENDQNLSKFTSSDISNALLGQRKYSTSALNLAVTEKYDNIALFLINNLKEYLTSNKIRLDDFIALITKQFVRCTLCSIYCTNSITLMTQIIEIIQRIDCNKLVKLFFCEDYAKCNILLLTFKYYNFSGFKDHFNTIIEFTDAKVLTELLVKPMEDDFPRFSYILPILHNVLKGGVWDENVRELILFMLKKLNQEQCMTVFCARDEFKRVPAHWAAFYSRYDFFEIMANFVTKKQFQKICTLRDAYDQIPLQLLCPLTSYFKPLCDKAGIDIHFRPDRSGWYFFDIENPECSW